jgi:tetratricopeptide (TPR) repeat protein
LVAAGVAAYADSLAGAWVFDDLDSIVANPTIRQLWPIGPVLCPPPGGWTVSGRPVLNLSFAVNYAISGLKPWSYHAVNLAIHLAGVLLLFEILCRVLPSRPNRILLAFGISGAWALHPLVTAAVSYVAQRAESMMGLFFLLSWLAVIRGRAAKHPWIWDGTAIAACALGMGTKEAMVAAPIVLLLFDRVFQASSWKDLWERRWRLHGGLWATTLLLAALVASEGGRRGTTAGYGSGLSEWTYLCAQFPAVMRYLGLSVWPSPLIFDYGRDWEPSPLALSVGVILVATLLVLTAIALIRRPRVGWVAASFFLLLAPSSGAVPIATERIAEHRMYLPLIAVIGGVVLALEWLAEKMQRERQALVLIFALLPVLLGLTAQRNLAYRTPLALWTDTVAKLPANPYAQNNLAKELIVAGRPAEAISHAQQALSLQPDFAEADDDWGAALDAAHLSGSLEAYRRALAISPTYFEARSNLAAALARQGRLEEAATEYRTLLAQTPTSAVAENDLGALLVRLGRPEEAAAHFERAARFDPASAPAQNNLGNVRLRQNDLAGAVSCFQRALQLDPGFAEAHRNLGIAWARQRHWPEAVSELEAAVAADPSSAPAREQLAAAQRILARTKP